MRRVLRRFRSRFGIGTYLKNGVSGFFADYALAEFTSAKIEALISDPEHFILVSENEEGLDGFIRLSSGRTAPVSGCSEVEISTFYVHPAPSWEGSWKAPSSCRITRVPR